MDGRNHSPGLAPVLLLAGLFGLGGIGGPAFWRPAEAQAQSQPDSATTTPPPLPSPSAAPLIPPRIGGYIQARTLLQKDFGFTALLNRARVGMQGPLPARFSYRVLVEFQASAGARLPATVSLREAIIQWSPAPFTLTAGEFKTPFSREYLIPVPLVELADLAVVVDSMAPKYDIGVMGEYALGPLATFSLGVFNGEGANSIANRDSTLLLVSRVTARPIPQVRLGASFTRDGADSLRWGVDVLLQQSGAFVRAEYITRHVDGRAQDQDDSGWYFLEGFRVTPRIQLVARQEDFQRPSRGAAARINAYAFGGNWEIAPNRIRLLLEYLSKRSGPAQTRANSYIAQMQVVF